MSTSRQHAFDLLAIGIGRTGGRIAGALARRGHSAMVIHTDKRAHEEQADLPAERRCFLGSAGSPLAPRALVEEQAKRLESLIRSHGEGHGALLICAGLEDESGEALTALARVIDRRGTRVVALAVLPSEGEPLARREAAVRTAAALTEAELDGLLFVDGHRIVERATDASILDLGDRLEERVLSTFDAIDGIDARDELRPVRPLSARGLNDAFTHGGVVSMGSTSIETLDTATMMDAIDYVVGEGEVGLDGVDPRTASALSVLIEAPRSTLMSTPAHLVSALRSALVTRSPGLVLDVALYERGPDQGPVVVHALASCASLPTRLHGMVEDVAREVEAVRSRARRAPRLDLGALDGKPEQKADEPPRLRAVSDIAPKPEARLAKEPGSPRAPMSTDAANKGPNRAVYARLVTRYKSTGNEELQRAIARRLEQDRLSEDFRVRILAVDAMAQIGAHVFDGSLFAATEDNSPEVRSIAERALATGNPTRAFS